jgi:hypothetical protein
MNKFIATVVLQNGETEVVSYTRDTMAEAYSAATRFYDGNYQSITIEADQHTPAVCAKLNQRVVESNAVSQTYIAHRVHHGVVDSIRFAASDLGLRPIDVARELGLAQTFLQHRG